MINLSLGDFLPLQSTLFDDPDYKAVLERAVGAGIVVVIAAGNNSLPKCENPTSRASSASALSTTPGTRSAFSSFGSNVDLMAPGGSGLGGSAEDVLSTYTESGYESISGTSQAAPHVAGVAALLVSLGLTGQEAADRILATAADAGAPGPDMHVRRGHRGRSGRRRRPGRPVPATPATRMRFAAASTRSGSCRGARSGGAASA